MTRPDPLDLANRYVVVEPITRQRPNAVDGHAVWLVVGHRPFPVKQFWGNESGKRAENEAYRLGEALAELIEYEGSER